MPGPIVQAGATIMCPHGGQVSAVTTNTKVLIGGVPAVTQSDTFPVAGCVFMVGSKPQPCVTAKWVVVATRVLIGGQPAVIMSGIGLCFSGEQAPQGPPIVASAQPKVVAT